ncbi:VOC family protein [Xenorhabdus bovienii]
MLSVIMTCNAISTLKIGGYVLHHVSLGVSDIERAAAFYDAAFVPLGYVRVWEDLRPGEADQAVGYGPEGSGDKLAIKFRPEGQCSPSTGFHLAFAAPDRKAVASFHKAALDHGGCDNGGPGLRPHYGPNYYAAFVIDPDGHHIEAVFNSTP